VSDDRSVTPPEPDFGAGLRARMQDAVARVEPRDGTLEFLRGAVTARRKQRRAAVATSAMMLLAVGAGLALAGRDLSRGGSGAAAAPGVRGVGAQSPRGFAFGGGRNTAGGQAVAKSSPQLAYPSTSAVPTGAVGKTSQGAMAPPALVTAAGVAVLPGCQRSSLSSVQTTQDPTVGGVMYDTVTATVKSACEASGPPRLYVYDAAGTLSTEIPVYRADLALAPELAPVDTWGRTLLLGPGDKYSFELAWAPAVQPCTAPPSGSAPSKSEEPSDPDTSAQPTDTPSLSLLAVLGTTPSGGNKSGRQARPPRDDYTIAYAVNGAPTIAMIPLVAGCGSAVYVTDIFATGEFPEPAAEPLASASPS